MIFVPGGVAAKAGAGTTLSLSRARSAIVSGCRSDGSFFDRVTMNRNRNASLHSLHENQSHLGWNNATAPVLKIDPGETIGFHPMDASGGQITVRSTAPTF